MKHRSRPSNARAQGATGVLPGVRVVAAFVAALAATVGSTIDTRAQTAPPRPLTQGLMPLETVEVMTVPGIDAEALADSERSAGAPGPLRFASPFETSVTPAGGEFGRWEEARDEGDSEIGVWRLRIVSADAVSLSLGFTRYAMPPEGRLWVYTPDYAQIAGPFTDADNESHGELWTPVLAGNEVVVEVAVPRGAADDLDLELGSVNRGFRDIFDTSDKQLSCNVDVICSEADAYRDVIRSVARIVIGGSGLCSGALLNNTAENGKPYFLTADHCGITAHNAASVVAYWNYESPTCGALSGGSLNQFQTGAYFRAGYRASDFTLIELDDDPDPAYKVHFAGWNRSTTEASSSVSIHHPQGDEKAISFDDDPTTTTSYSGEVGGDGSHLWVIWDRGTTEGGSSGSPLFDQDKRVIGQLHGGFGQCTAVNDWYGRVSTSWQGGGTAASRLSDFLDPLSTGTMTLDGQDSGGGPGGPGGGPSGLTPTQLGRYRDMWQTLTPSDGCTVEDLGAVSGTVTRNGTLGHDCVSPNWSGELARYYSFTLATDTVIQIDMTSSAVDAWLGLRQGAGTSGTLLLADDDSGGGTNARITTDGGIVAGTYTIEVSTAVAGVAATGPFALTLSVGGGDDDDCTVENLGTVSGTVTRNGTLGHDCVSPNWSGELARYYSFTLATDTVIQIDMTSSAVDAWLGLRQGAGTSGTLLLADDDSGGGTNARITTDGGIVAGTYTIEVSTAVAGVAATGPFALTLSVGGGDDDDCTVENLGTVSGTVTRNGTLGHDCVSPNWSGELARYYSFTLATDTVIQIDMTSSAVDAWLGLRQGAGTSGTLLLADDDSGGGTNARITTDGGIVAGTYTIEVSTAVSGVAATGAFTLTLSVGGGGCTVENLGNVSGTVTRNGTLGHDCVSPNWGGELARFYSFTLTADAIISIDMTSSAVDAWLGLRQGAGTSGTLLLANNDGGSGTNARITTPGGITRGTYTIEASTAVPGVAATGAFTLRLVASLHDGNEIVSQRSVVTTFTDHPVRPGTTPVKAAHFREIRARIAALRERAGLPAVSWTDPTLTAGATPVKRVHLTELRTALDAAYDALVQPRPVYTDAAVTGGLTVIKAVHVAELRAAVAALEATE